ncbi:hypothetical protein FA15DRAFT_671897 [Coprinopsis marcescibilis]|uniref:Amidohydrolase 3 domain-containing protein n=1 Tax=Coprinopsis marcescibilis TaxID=230819 RepID=A0A5C3KP92_COPMA|nr:hypothetical protein FA15DRAFT_671897 [Coprinopsis marcescibilis]
MGVMASVQPSHALSDIWLGPDRVKQLYSFQSLLKAGARLTLGSDLPVDDIDPLAGFYAVVTRRLGRMGRVRSPGWCSFRSVPSFVHSSFIFLRISFDPAFSFPIEFRLASVAVAVDV